MTIHTDVSLILHFNNSVVVLVVAEHCSVVLLASGELNTVSL